MQVKFDKVSYFPARSDVETMCSIRELDFEIELSGLTGIMGNAGCGKSGLLQLMSGMLHPDIGTILINGADINSKKYKRSNERVRCACVLRGAERTVYEKNTERELSSAIRGLGLSDEEKRERMDFALSCVGLEWERTAPIAPSALSAEERYKLAIAAALVSKPDILLLDEPLLQLVGNGRKVLSELFKKIESMGCHVVIATNDADFLAEYAETVLVMRRGTLIRMGSPKTVFADYYDLIRNGIPVPKVKLTAQKLRERGVNMPSNVVDYENFIDRLKIIMWRKEK